MSSIPLNLQRLVTDVLPKGFQVVQAGEGEASSQAYFHVCDADNRRRTFSHGVTTIDELYGEIRKLAVEVRRLDYWKRKAAITTEDIDALVESVCTNLPKLKGSRWGFSGAGIITPCCQTAVAADTWWIHEDASVLGHFAPQAAAKAGPDLAFPQVADFARYLIARKESRFERGLHQ
jgi:hypothetical protein